MNQRRGVGIVEPERRGVGIVEPERRGVGIVEPERRGVGKVEPERRGERHTGEYRSQSWVENTNIAACTQEIGYLQSINSNKHLPQSPFAGQFLDDDIFHCIL